MACIGLSIFARPNFENPKVSIEKFVKVDIIVILSLLFFFLHFNIKIWYHIFWLKCQECSDIIDKISLLRKCCENIIFYQNILDIIDIVKLSIKYCFILNFIFLFVYFLNNSSLNLSICNCFYLQLKGCLF